MLDKDEKLSFHFIGDAFVDLFCYLEAELPESGGDARLRLPVSKLAGGSAVNTTTHFAALLKDFLEESTTIGFPDVKLHTVVNPQDEYGRVILQHAEHHGFPLMNCRKHDDSTSSTGHCVVMVTGGERSFITHAGCIGDFEASDLDGTLLVGTPTRLAHHSHIHIAGFYNIPGFWNGKLKETLTWIREKRQSLPCDTSTTISLVPQHDASGEWDGKILDLMPLLDFAIMNDLEANYITGRKNEEIGTDCAQDWASFFQMTSKKTWVVVTRGELGAVAMRDGSVLVQQPAVQVNVVDPTGSGDCFSAAFLYGIWSWRHSSGFDLVHNEWPLEAVKQGLVWGCGAATCGTLTRGASVPSRKEDIERFVKETANRIGCSSG